MGQSIHWENLAYHFAQGPHYLFTGVQALVHRLGPWGTARALSVDSPIFCLLVFLFLLTDAPSPHFSTVLVTVSHSLPFSPALNKFREQKSKLLLWEKTCWSWSVVLFFNVFNWRIIALQNFVAFCHTSIRISHRYTHVPSLPDLPPISLPIPPFSLSQRPCLSSLSHTANSHWLFSPRSVSVSWRLCFSLGCPLGN